MAYETGVASDPSDLVSKLCTFAAANGWTANTPASGRVLVKGNVVCGINGDADSLDTRAAVTYAGGSAWDAQTNNAGQSHVCNIGAGPYTAYHFYALSESSKDLLAAVVEISAGIFRHWILCDLIQAGTYTGGPYTDSQFHSTEALRPNIPASTYHRYIADTILSNVNNYGHFRCDVDALTNNWVAVRSSTESTASTMGTGCQKTNGKFLTLLDAGWQRWNLRTPLLPIELFVNRASSLRSPVGRVPSMRLCNVQNHAEGEIVTIGGSDYQLWPCVARTDAWGDTGSSTPSSGYYGYAYKRT